MSDKREICMQEYDKVVLCESEIRYGSKVDNVEVERVRGGKAKKNLH